MFFCSGTVVEISNTQRYDIGKLQLGLINLFLLIEYKQRLESIDDAVLALYPNFAQTI